MRNVVEYRYLVSGFFADLVISSLCFGGSYKYHPNRYHSEAIPMEINSHLGGSLNPFTLREGENLQRPRLIRRLTFEPMFSRAYWFEAAPFARAIIPIELVQPGDEQIVVHQTSAKAIDKPLSIDFLADLPSVVSIVADRLVIARRPLPQIRELFVVNPLATVDGETLSNLPGLVSLSLGTGWGIQKSDPDEIVPPGSRLDRIDLRLLQGIPGLRDLRFQGQVAASLDPLQYLTGLERLRIEGAPPGRNAKLLAPLQKLRWLAIEYWQGLRNLEGLVKLERLELMQASFANLNALKNLKKLRWLALNGSGVKSLEGIGELANLEDLFLGGTGVHDLAPLANLSRLRRLKIAGANRVEDFSPIGYLEDLRSLTLILGSFTEIAHLESIGFIAGLEHLEELEINGAEIDDRRLDALFNLPKIRRVRLLGNYGEQVERLHHQKPGIAIEVIGLESEEASGLIRIGPLKIHKHENDFWSIFQDLSDFLGLENNFDADRMIRQAIQQRDLDLLNRLEFDPDADFVSINAKNEDDIRKAAEIIRSIIGKPQANYSSGE